MLALRIGAGAALLAGILACAADGAAKVFDPRTFTLANGLQVVVVENHRAPIVTHMVWYRVGAADDPAGKSGLAHFLEHLMFRGTKDFPLGAFAREVARVGGEQNAFTTQDYTAFYETVAVEHLGLMMRLEADRMVNLQLSEEVVSPERNVILEERRQRIDNEPAAQLAEAVRAALYRNHPYHDPAIGWENEMRGLDRQDAVDFYGRWYAPNNAVVVICGDVTLDQVRPLAEAWYGRLARREVPARIRLQEPPQNAARRVILESQQVRQPAWTRHYAAPSYHADPDGQAYALEVLAEILGGGSTSRLYRRLVVESKVAAGIGVTYLPESLDSGIFAFSGSPLPGGRAEAVEAAIDAEIARLLAEGVTAEEVASAKVLLLADAIKARDSLSVPARAIGTDLTTGRSLEDTEAWPERIGAVTVEQVNAAARSVLDIRASVSGLLLPKPTS